MRAGLVEGDGGVAVGPRLPGWRRPLAVVAHPDDESFGLGAVLHAFAVTGARVAVHCFTRGEASTLVPAAGDLRTVRAAELAAAGRVLGVDTVHLRDHPDGRLREVEGTLADEVARAARGWRADGLVVFDRAGVTGHPDHAAATRAALAAGERLGLPALEWTLPIAVAEQLNAELGTRFAGHEPADIQLVLPVERARQCAAIHEHASQATPSSPLWRRLQLLGGYEYLRLTAAGPPAPSP